ncbi:MAG: hypothetical protein AB7G23_21430 [Vicinamibacterales bacterium]
MTVALNLGLAGLAVLALLPLLFYLLYLLWTEWRLVPSGINATRVLMVVWSGTFEFMLLWSLYTTWHRTAFEKPTPWVEEGSLASTILLFTCAMISLVVFVLRQKNAASASYHRREH